MQITERQFRELRDWVHAIAQEEIDRRLGANPTGADLLTAQAEVRLALGLPEFAPEEDNQ